MPHSRVECKGNRKGLLPPPSRTTPTRASLTGVGTCLVASLWQLKAQEVSILPNVLPRGPVVISNNSVNFQFGFCLHFFWSSMLTNMSQHVYGSTLLWFSWTGFPASWQDCGLGYLCSSAGHQLLFGHSLFFLPNEYGVHTYIGYREPASTGSFLSQDHTEAMIPALRGPVRCSLFPFGCLLPAHQQLAFSFSHH